MPLAIRIISSPNDESISEQHKSFPEEGGDIGRSLGVTMQLADSHREISAVHAIVKKTSYGYQVVDNSTNGLFVNGSNSPIGKGNKYALTDGDILDVGRYRLLISCFTPELAKRPTLAQDNQIFDDSLHNESQIIDDPFAKDLELLTSPTCDTSEPVRKLIDDPFNSEPELALADASPATTAMPLFQAEEDIFSFDGDPYRAEKKQQESRSHWDLEFHFDALGEAPLTNMEYQTKLTAPLQKEERSRQDPISVMSDFRQKERTDKALEIAFARLMDDISPASMEAMFDDLVRPAFWRRKSNYWTMFKRYFNRQIDNQDWQIKLHAYFHEALRQQNSFGGEPW